MRTLPENIAVRAFERLRPLLEVVEGWGMYPPNHKHPNGGDNRLPIRTDRLPTLWMRWNPKGKRRPTFSEFLKGYKIRVESP
jgi:hypothetical protein